MKSKKPNNREAIPRKKKETIRKKKKLRRLKKQRMANQANQDENITKTKVTKRTPDPLKIKKSPEKEKPTADVKSRKSSSKLLETIQREQKQQRVKQLKIANSLEDKNIKKIEKQLKMNKRKSKSIPKSFVDDGLDFLLEVCDPEKRAKLAHEEFDFADNDAGFEEDLAVIRSKNLDSNTKKGSDPPEMETGEEEEEDDNFSNSSDADGNSNFDEEDGHEESSMEEGNSESEEMAEESEVSEADGDVQEEESHSSVSENEEQSVEKKAGYWEDIYGRLRDPSGNVVSSKEEKPSGKYVPPGKRLQASSNDDSAEMERLKRQTKGLFNRLAEANMPGIVSSIEQLYLTNSRHSMQQAINTLIVDSLVVPILSPERLIMEHCVVIAALHANIGTEVGAQFLELIVRRFDSLFEANNNDQDKVMDNLILILAYLYNFGLVAAPLLTDILGKLAERFSEKDIEMILIILRSVGFALRKDDPVALKQVILNLQTKAGQTTDQPTRIRFMLDVLLAIRNNNVAKIPNYDPSHAEHLRKILRNNLIRKGASLSKMNISYNELLAADRRGRWWVVGSAWTGQGPAAAESKSSEELVGGKELQFNAELLEMARKQR